MSDIEKRLSNKKLNTHMKKMLTSNFDTDTIAKAITHFAFRNGPIEDMHADRDKNITDQDMRVLNKYVHNRLAYVFELIMQERWAEFALVVESQKFYGSEWDKSEPDDGGTKELIRWQLEAAAAKEE
ncbi:hypothetical protein [Paenibacillus tyrfis]|uniref:hypothetical protein n=1 Tax=Paenibacillus tyrfis TaxID=1501230 RepID=UPI000B5929F8|nr:hypothetical protein [Paenibacillus tyrfis]